MIESADGLVLEFSAVWCAKWRTCKIRIAEARGNLALMNYLNTNSLFLFGLKSRTFRASLIMIQEYETLNQDQSLVKICIRAGFVL